MKQYDVRCPICGTVNRGLYLEETHGWMECEKCGNEVMSMKIAKAFTVKVPLLKNVMIRDVCTVPSGGKSAY